MSPSTPDPARDPAPELSADDLPSDPDARAVAELALLERENGRVPITIGPFAAYLIAGALRSAVRAPGLGEGLVRIGSEVAESALAGLDWKARLIAEHLDEIADALGPDADPAAAPEYVADIAHLNDLERGGQNKGTIELGPYSSFACIGLLQLVTRHPQFGPGSFGHDVIIGFCRQMQAPYSERVQALIERGFDPANDYA